MHIPASTPHHIEDIVVLRGVAIFLVILCHVRSGLIPSWHTPALDTFYSYVGGGFGVDIFFAISGYVITRDLYPRLKACTSTSAFMTTSLAFWIRRAWRIMPSAWLWLALIVLATITFNTSGVFLSLDSTLRGSVAAILQIHNYWIAKCFAGHYDCGPNFYYWSLSLEEQFYLLLPFAILVLQRRWLIITAACLIAFQLLTPNRFPIMVVFRNDALLLGVLIALWENSPSNRRFGNFWSQVSPWIRHAIFACLIVVLSLDAWLERGILVSYHLSIAAIASAAIVLLLSFDKNIFLPHGLVRNALIRIGQRSWTLYLIHVPAFLVIREIWHRAIPGKMTIDHAYALPFLLSGLAMVYLLGELNYRLLEVPSRRKGALISARFMEKHGGAKTIPPK